MIGSTCLFCSPAPALLLCQGRARFEGVEDDAGELAFQATDGFATALAFGLFAFEVGARGGMYARFRDRDSIEGRVELAVAAAVEAVALDAAGAGLEWCDATMSGELGVALEAADRADLGEQLGGGERTAAGQLEQCRRSLGGPLLVLTVELADRARERAAARDQLAGEAYLQLCWLAGEPAADAIKLRWPVECFRGHGEGAVELVQVPAQSLLRPAPLVDEIIAGSTSSFSSRNGCSSGRGRLSRGSRKAARATASASIASDLPRNLPARRSAAISFGGTRTSSSPAPRSSRSSARVSWRQSSSAHSRPAGNDADHASTARSSPAVTSASVRPTSSTATAVSECLCTSTPITII